jgi:formylglycine-generating enzyme required for sulfatase activity
VLEALARLGKDRAELAEPACSFLRPEAERLLAEIAQPATSHYRRAEIGDRLASIGDARPGVGVLPNGAPDIDWCEIPAGTVKLEGGHGKFSVARFHIARYPLTWQQYQAFVADPQGYADHQRWWQGLQREASPGEQFRPIGNCRRRRENGANLTVWKWTSLPEQQREKTLDISISCRAIGNFSISPGM